MIIFLYGKDTFRSRQKLKELALRHQNIHKSGLNLKYFSGDDFSFEEFSDQAHQVSMFEEKKLFVLSGFFANKGFQEKFLEKGKEFASSKDIFLFYEEGDMLKTNRLFRFLIEKGKTQKFEPLSGTKLISWIKKRAVGLGGDISPSAVKKLVDYVGDDLWQADNEIKKLVSFKSKKLINPEDIDILVRAKVETNIFKTIEAISQKDKKKALFLLHWHLGKGDNPLYLLSMVNFQFRNLLIVKDLSLRNISYPAIIKQSKLHPFVARKSYQLSQKFTLEELKRIYQKIFEADLQIKKGRLDPQAALDLLVAEI